MKNVFMSLMLVATVSTFASNGIVKLKKEDLSKAPTWTCTVGTVTISDKEAYPNDPCDVARFIYCKTLKDPNAKGCPQKDTFAISRPQTMWSN